MKLRDKILRFLRTNTKRSAINSKNRTGSIALPSLCVKLYNFILCYFVSPCVAKCLSLFSRHERSGYVARRGEKEIVTLQAFYANLILLSFTGNEKPPTINGRGKQDSLTYPVLFGCHGGKLIAGFGFKNKRVTEFNGRFRLERSASYR